MKHWLVMPCTVKQLQDGYRNSEVEEYQLLTCITVDFLCPFMQIIICAYRDFWVYSALGFMTGVRNG
jgi:hypothetical protein